MSRREEIDRSESEAMFTKHAQRVHPVNALPMQGNVGPMRGGIRL